MASWLDDAIALNNWSTMLEAGGSFAGALSTIQQGREAQKAAQFAAEQMRTNAGQQQAASQRAAYDIAREAEYTASRALAVAAASGGGASDPTVLNIIARNAQEMAYRRQMALYEGDEAARAMRMGAAAKEYEGASARRAANEAAIGQAAGGATSLLRGYAREASLRQRFGGSGPDMTGSI